MRKRTYRTQVYYGARKRIIQRSMFIHRNDRAVTPIKQTEFRSSSNLLTETDTTGTTDTPFTVKIHGGSQRKSLHLVFLLFQEATRFGVVLVVVILQLTVTGLITDRAIEGVVDKDEL
jgi:hypothetical protein